MVVIISVIVFLAYAPFEIGITTLAVIAFASSLVVVTTWTPYALVAISRDKERFSWMSLADLAAMSYLGLFVTGARLWIAYTDGVPLPVDDLRSFISLGVWFMVAFATGIRAYSWLQTLARHPTDVVLDIVSGNLDRRP